LALELDGRLSLSIITSGSGIPKYATIDGLREGGFEACLDKYQGFISRRSSMPVPHIKTAIPLQRHQIGSFVATVLGEIESDDPVDYRYIMAIVEDGKQEPVLFLTSERNRGAASADETYRLRVVMGAQEKFLNPSDEWGDVDKFSLAGMGIIAKLMRLEDETPVRLM
jgi:hypothetical protein